MTIATALKTHTTTLQGSGFDSAVLDVMVLLSHITGKSREHLYAYPDEQLSSSQQKKLNTLIVRRTKGVPIAYLTGHKEFFGLDFSVNKSVLIPRPETELLVEATLQLLKTNPKQTVVDVGCGSGAIAISIKVNSPETTVMAGDISRRALKITRKNAARHRADIVMRRSDLLTKFKRDTIDIVVANLPYLSEQSKEKRPTADTIGLRYEPATALYSGDDGLGHYRRLFEQLAELTRKPRHVIIEIGDTQGKAVRKLAAQLLPKATVAIRQDYCGLDRLAHLTLK